MILYIDTTLYNKIKIEVRKKGKVFIKNYIQTNRDQSEKLLPGIGKALKAAGIDLRAVEKILVNNKGGTFSSLRIGVATANALGYALGAPVKAEDQCKTINKELNIVKPEYNKEPNITLRNT